MSQKAMNYEDEYGNAQEIEEHANAMDRQTNAAMYRNAYDRYNQYRGHDIFSSVVFAYLAQGLSIIFDCLAAVALYTSLMGLNFLGAKDNELGWIVICLLSVGLAFGIELALNVYGGLTVMQRFLDDLTTHEKFMQFITLVTGLVLIGICTWAGFTYVDFKGRPDAWKFSDANIGQNANLKKQKRDNEDSWSGAQKEFGEKLISGSTNEKIDAERGLANAKERFEAERQRIQTEADALEKGTSVGSSMDKQYSEALGATFDGSFWGRVISIAINVLNGFTSVYAGYGRAYPKYEAKAEMQKAT